VRAALQRMLRGSLQCDQHACLLPPFTGDERRNKNRITNTNRRRGHAERLTPVDGINDQDKCLTMNTRFRPFSSALCVSV
jgi:hypothetical protein